LTALNRLIRESKRERWREGEGGGGQSPMHNDIYEKTAFKTSYTCRHSVCREHVQRIIYTKDSDLIFHTVPLLFVG